MNEILEYIKAEYIPLLSAGVAGGFISIGLEHLLSKSRDKENFERTLNHDESEKQIKILNQLSVFANGILNCWEDATFMTSLSTFGDGDNPINVHAVKKIEFHDYKTIRDKLLDAGVFDGKSWHQLDKIPQRIDEINEKIKRKTSSEVTIDCHHFSELSKALWGMVATEYVRQGGNLDDLTKPMPSPYDLEKRYTN